MRSVLLDHCGDEFFDDVVRSARLFCPGVTVAWYYSGHSGDEVAGLRTHTPHRLPSSRPLEYAKVTTFFLDMIEWAAEEQLDAVVNIESDMAFVRPGFHAFVVSSLETADYVAPRFQRSLSPGSRWRPAHSLRGQRQELMRILGVDHLNGGFSPGQIFGHRFIAALLDAPFYGELRDFVERNRAPGRSFSLQEVLFPTLVDALGLRAGLYPQEADRLNRYRPFHSLRSVRGASVTEGVHFVHPVARDPGHPARMFVRTLIGSGVDVDG